MGDWLRATRRGARHLGTDLLDAALDRTCPGCGGALERGVAVCDACDAAIPRSGSTLCLRCLRGDPSGSEAPADAPHRVCPQHGPGRLLLCGPRYAPPLDQILHSFKYEGAWRLAPWLASLLPEPPGHDGPLWREYVIVPVPLHPARLAARGFDQCALLAGDVSRRWGIPVVPALARAQDGVPQARRRGAARRTALHGTFHLAQPGLVADRAVLLLDDVATTGSTLLAAADALKEARPAWILSLAAAHGGDPEGPESGPDVAVAGAGTPVVKSHAWRRGAERRSPRS